MGTNYVLMILGAGVVSMIVGSVWYGPLFGKKWLEVIGATELDLEKRKDMQKKAGPLYLVQFLLALLQIFILQLVISGLHAIAPCTEIHCRMSAISAIVSAFVVWLGFVMPTIAACAMWNNDSSKIKWARFLIQSGYQLVMFIIFGWMIVVWA